MIPYGPALVALSGLVAIHAVNIDTGANVGVFASMMQEVQELHHGSKMETEDLDDPLEDADIGEAPQIGNVKGAKTVKWSEESGLKFEVEAVIALSWVTMVAGLPLIVMKIEGKNITNTQLAIFGALWIVFFGGIFLFTQLVVFQSVHFDRVRPLNIIEAVYLMAQILTTVGYGDITPAKQRGQVFIGIYVLFSIMVIANVMSEVFDHITEEGKKFTAEMRKQLKYMLDEVGQGEPDPEKVAEQTFSSKWASFTSNVEPMPLDYRPLIGSLAAYLSFLLMGCLFFHYYPGEGKTWFQGVYMSIITLSTVGFGAFTPVTRGGLVFGAFWMTFGSLTLVGVVGAFASLVNQNMIRERWSPESVKKEQLEFLAAFPEKSNRADFIRRSLLHKQLVDESELDAIEQFFDELNPDEAGEVNKASLEQFMVQKGKMKIEGS
jgi:hypothetical protein